MSKMIANALGRLVPTEVEGLGEFAPFTGAFDRLRGDYSYARAATRRTVPACQRDKVTKSIREAIERSGLKDGMTISFHHHMRNGDGVLPLVMREIQAMGIKDLTLAPSSLTDAHDCVADMIEAGVVTGICSSGMRGRIGQAVSEGKLARPALIYSHGGRARAIEEGRIHIDVAFLGAPTCDKYGNFTGSTGPSACGSLGYAMMDAKYASHVVAVTDNLVDYPLMPRISIPEQQVDQVLLVDSIGDPRKIASGTVRYTRDPVQLRQAWLAFELIKASGYLAPGLSYQAGAGGASLAVTGFLKDYMLEKGIKGSFGVGGISGHTVDMLEHGLFDAVLDVQSFDAAVTGSLHNNPRHIEIDASGYANPFAGSCAVNHLDVVVLAALDVDVDFNVNVMTGLDGVLRGASGGHSDTAAGAKLSVVLCPCQRTRVPAIREHVQTVVTPGETVDAIVTERGICINPRNEELLRAAQAAKLPVLDIHKLKDDIETMTGKPEPVPFDESKVVAVVEYRDGTLIDSIYKVK